MKTKTSSSPTKLKTSPPRYVNYATNKTELELAEDWLFRPMGFRNYEWMHEDTVGLDNGAYGLRLRPVDMQKFGLLFLRRGVFDGQRLLSSAWVDRSWAPWISSNGTTPNYGWYWWTTEYAPHWTSLGAHGWKGKRIAIFPEKNVVVTMTGIIEDQNEETVFQDIVRRYVVRAVDGSGGRAAHPDPALRKPLADVMEQVRQGPLRVKPDVEARMIPSIAPKGTHHPFTPN